MEAGWKQAFGLNLPQEEGSVSGTMPTTAAGIWGKAGRKTAWLLVLAGWGRETGQQRSFQVFRSVEGNSCRGEARPAAGQGLLTGSLQLSSLSRMNCPSEKV